MLPADISLVALRNALTGDGVTQPGDREPNQGEAVELDEIQIPDLNGEANHTEKVRRLFSANPDRVLRPKDVRQAFDCVPDAYVGPLLARLRERGEIARVAYGKYRVANGKQGREPRNPVVDEFQISWVQAVGDQVVVGTEDDRLLVARRFEAIDI